MRCWHSKSLNPYLSIQNSIALAEIIYKFLLEKNNIYNRSKLSWLVYFFVLVCCFTVLLLGYYIDIAYKHLY